MRDEYDFSKGERGKFYRPDAQLNIPIYLDDDVHAYLSERAEAKGVEINVLVNEILKKDIELFEALE
jgi:hypothetical protein